MAEIILDGRNISELKVTELKDELEKRGLPKKGVKTVLLNRLRTSILKELESAPAPEDADMEEANSSLDHDQSELDVSVSEAPPASSSETPGPVEEQQMSEEPTSATSAPTNQIIDAPVSHDDSLDTSHDEQLFIPLDDASQRRESVTFDSSYQPEGEELLYEGDVEEAANEEKETVEAKAEEAAKEDTEATTNEPLDTEAAKEESEAPVAGDDVMVVSKDAGGPKPEEAAKEESKEEAAKDESKEPPREEGFIVQLHDTSMLEIEFDKKSAISNNCHLWVKGLSSTVRAKDLQTLFTPYGKVVTAKVVAKAQSRNERFGYVTMATAEEAQKSIATLNGTEIKGRTISVELATTPPPISGPSPKVPPTGTPAGNKPKPKLVKKVEVKPASGVGSRKSLDSVSSSRKVSPIRTLSRSAERGRGRSPRRSPPTATRRSPRQSPPMPRRIPRRSPPLPRRSPRRSPPMSRRSPRRSPPLRRFRSPSPGYREPVRNRLGPRVHMSAERGREVAMRRDVDRGRRMREEQERQEHQRIEAMRHAESLRAREQQEMRRIAEIREREARDRDARERVFRERERELREREARERQRREALEKQLHDQEIRVREREKKMKEAYERDMEVKAAREAEAREEEARMMGERQRALREREKRLKDEADRIEAARRLQREESARLQRERQQMATAAAERERKILEEKKRKQEEEKQRSSARAQPSNQRAPPPSNRAPPPNNRAPPPSNRASQPSFRLGKRGFNESSSYEGNGGSNKRPSLEGYPSGGSPSNVFGRLDPLPKAGNQGDVYRRSNEGFDRRGGFSRGGGRYSNDRGNSLYQLASSVSGPSLHSAPAASMYSSALMSGRKANDGGVSLAGVTPEVMSAAAQVLQNINKQVGLTNLPLPNRSSPQVNMATQLQQIAAAQRMPASTFDSPYAQFGYPPPGKKLPPEGERYNRRMSGRSSGHHDNMSHDLFKNPRM